MCTKITCVCSSKVSDLTSSSSLSSWRRWPDRPLWVYRLWLRPKTFLGLLLWRPLRPLRSLWLLYGDKKGLRPGQSYGLSFMLLPEVFVVFAVSVVPVAASEAFVAVLASEQGSVDCWKSRHHRRRREQLKV